MGERYWITAVQLNLFIHLRKEETIGLVNKIVDEQFIGNYRTAEEQNKFKEKIKEIK
jgi:hypothetical protein